MSGPVVGITMGDPAGIGPEVTLRACAKIGADLESRLVVLGDHGHMAAVAADLGLDLDPRRVASAAQIPDGGGAGSIGVLAGTEFEAGIEGENDDDDGEAGPSAIARPRLAVLQCCTLEPGCAPGRPRPSDGRAALECIVAGADMAAAGELTALVTAPVSKRLVAGVEIGFRGHTEFLAARAGVAEPVMVFAGPRPAVALLTTHLPLATAVASVRRTRLLSLVRRLNDGWTQWFGAPPDIGVAGLNPHAGEDGLLGAEEQHEILPAIAVARAEGIAVSGPYPADSIFRHTGLDIVVALYHDQGTIIAKRASEPSVNVTLGLPYPRTSPDHGVAYDLAGQRAADPAAMEAAIRLAAQMAARR